MQDWSDAHAHLENDQAGGVAVGSSGVYVCGTEDRDDAGESRRGVVKKYDFEGNVLWTVHPIAASQSHCRGIVVGSDDDPVFVGVAWSNRWDAHVAKLDGETGEDVWVRGYNTGGADERFFGIALANNDDVLPVGSTFVSGQTDLVMQRYDGTGELLWTASQDHAVWDTAWGAAVGLDDDAYVVGTVDDNAGTRSGVLCRLDGTTGNPVWFDVQNLGGAVEELADVVIDPEDGQAIVLGHDYETGGVTLRKYDEAGGVVWTQSYAGGLGTDDALGAQGGLAIDADGTVYFAGTANNATPDLWLRAFDSDDGSEVWTASIDPFGGPDYGRDVALNGVALYVVGEANTGNSDDIFVAQLSK